MLRMAHRIATNRLTALWAPGDDAPQPEAYKAIDAVKTMVGEAPVVIADNVKEFVHATRGKLWNFSRDIPGAVPFDEAVFVEWGESLGAMLIRTDATEPSIERRWIVQIFPFISLRGVPTMIDARIIFDIDESGCITRGFYGRLDGRSMTDATGERFNGELSDFLIVPLLAMSFANCKNVVRRDVTETEGPPAKWIRRQKAPTIRYHILDINPMKEVLRTEGGIEHNGLKKALHICRGHFATYTEDKPLFGHITGTFWKPSHVRGHVESGIVDKDYRLKLQSDEK